MADDTTDYLSLYSKVYNRVTNDNPSNPSYAVIDSKSTNGSEDDGQTQLTTLAAYYLLAPNNSSKGALDFYGGENTSTPWVVNWSPPPGKFNHWSQTATYNVGTPLSSLPSKPVALQSGQESDGSTYYVYERAFTGQNGQSVLVLYKPLSAPKDVGSGTATTVNLKGSYYALQTDGTLSSTAETSISLVNGEGAILVQAGGMMMAPMLAKSSPPTLASGSANLAAAMPTSESSSASSSISQSNPGPTSGELFFAELFERLLPAWFIPNAASLSQTPPELPKDSSLLSAKMDLYLSLLSVANLPKVHGSNSPFDELFWPVDDAIAESSISSPS